MCLSPVPLMSAVLGLAWMVEPSRIAGAAPGVKTLWLGRRPEDGRIAGADENRFCCIAVVVKPRFGAPAPLPETARLMSETLGEGL